MNNVFKICCLVTAMICVMAVNARATPINSPASCNSAFIVGSDCADLGSGQSFMFRPFMVLPAHSPSPLASLRAFIFDGISDRLGATGINISGHGIAHITGFDNASGDWYFGVSRAGGTNSLSPSTEIHSVPEPTTMFLLGSGLLGLGALRRRKNSDKG